jgi:hypothetical protein
VLLLPTSLGVLLLAGPVIMCSSSSIPAHWFGT